MRVHPQPRPYSHSRGNGTITTFICGKSWDCMQTQFTNHYDCCDESSCFCLYDNHCSLAVNIGLGTALLLRFDLIFKLVDSSDASWDDNITTYLLNQAIHGPPVVAKMETTQPTRFCPNHGLSEILRAYITIV